MFIECSWGKLNLNIHGIRARLIGNNLVFGDSMYWKLFLFPLVDTALLITFNSFINFKNCAICFTFSHMLD